MLILKLSLAPLYSFKLIPIMKHMRRLGDDFVSEPHAYKQNFGLLHTVISAGRWPQLHGKNYKVPALVMQIRDAVSLTLL